MQVSVIVTVFNEAASIERLLASLASQSRLPDEVVVCDGGSSDGTPELIQAFARQDGERLPHLRLLVEPGANISRGRNLAIAAARHPLIAVADAGVRLSPDWLAELVAPWDAAGMGDDVDDDSIRPLAVAGFFMPDAVGPFQTAMAATVLPLPGDINPDTFLPSSRSVAFTKAAWQRAGGYPEWLDYCEDLLFDFAINAQMPDTATAFVWAPKALVYFRPRESLAAFWKQYYRYGRGDGKADLWRKRHAARYVTYLVLLPALLGHGLWGERARWLGWAGLLCGVLFYCRRPWQRVGELGQGLGRRQRWAAAAMVPVIRLVGDLAKMAGYPVGLWWRWQRRGAEQLDWRSKLEQIDVHDD